MSARARSLPPAEIAVGGGGAAFARRYHIAVDADAHGAAGFTPFEAGVAEDMVEPFLLGLALDGGRAGRHQSGNLAHPPCEDRGCSAQILDARIGAGADEDAVDRYIGELRARRKPHVVE